MIKILFFIDTLTGGGAEKVLRTLVNNLDQSRFEITVQTVDYCSAEGLLVPGIRYKAINRFHNPLIHKLYSLWIRLCGELNWIYPLYIRDDYDIEAAYLECGPTKFLSGSTNKKASKLAWVHCDLERKGIEATKRMRRIYSKYDKIICVSQRVKEAFQQLFGNYPESLVLYNVNDDHDIIFKSKSFSPEKPDVFTFIIVGRLSYEKGVDRLIDACSILSNMSSKFHLWILGEGPERSSLEAQVKTLGLQDCVEFLGFQDNPYPYILSADCVVCASRYEGFSTVVTEALILGKTVVTTPCSGMDELLGNNEYGMITQDSTEGIFQGMQEIMNSPTLHKRYADAAYARGKTFSKSETLNKTQCFFEAINNPNN